MALPSPSNSTISVLGVTTCLARVALSSARVRSAAMIALSPLRRASVVPMLWVEKKI
ncbi:hypothetical protein D3C79_1025500 [compost metagenome]